MEFYILPFVCYLVNLAGAALLGSSQIGVENGGFLVRGRIHQAELRNQGPPFEISTGSLSHSSGQTAALPLQGVVAADSHKQVGSAYSGGNIGGFVSSGDSGRRLSESAVDFVKPGSHSGGISHSKTESINEEISTFPASRFAANADVKSMPMSFGFLHGSVSTNEGVMNGGVLSGRVGAQQGSVTSIGSGIDSNFAVKTLQYPSQSHSSINAGSIFCTSSGGLGCSSPHLKSHNADIRLGSANGVSDGIPHSMIHGSDENTGGIIEADIRLGLAGLENDHLTGRISTGIDKTSATRGYAISPGTIRVSKPVGYTGSAYATPSGSLGLLPSSNVGSNFGSDLGRLITPGLLTFEPSVFGGSVTGAFHGSTPSKNTGGNSSPLIGVIGGFPGSTSTSYSGSNAGSVSKSYGVLSGDTSSSNAGSKDGSLLGLIGRFPETTGTINSGSNAGSVSKINYGLSGSMSSSYGGNNAGSLTGGFHGHPGTISSTNSESNAAAGGYTGINVSHASSSEANSNAGGGYEEFSGY